MHGQTHAIIISFFKKVFIALPGNVVVSFLQNCLLNCLSELIERIFSLQPLVQRIMRILQFLSNSRRRLLLLFKLVVKFSVFRVLKLTCFKCESLQRLHLLDRSQIWLVLSSRPTLLQCQISVDIFALLCELKRGILLAKLQFNFASYQVDIDVHFRIYFFSAFFFDLQHLFGVVPLVFVEPSIVGQLVPVGPFVQHTQTTSSIDVELNQLVSML